MSIVKGQPNEQLIHDIQAALEEGNEKMVELLLAAGAEANAQGGYYGNALYAAS